MRALSAALVCAALAWPTVAWGQQGGDNDVVVARETFRAGEAAYARGDFETAANAFEVSNRLSPHPFTMFNAGLAWEAAGKPAAAADAFHVAIDSGGLGEEQAADAIQRLGELRKSLGWVVIDGPASARVAVRHAERSALPALVHLPAGAHEVAVTHADGSTATQSVTIAVGQEAALSFEAPAGKPEPPPVTEQPPPPPPEGGDSGVSGLFVGGWVVAGLGVAAGGAAIGLGVTALGAKDDFESSGNTDADARDTAATMRTATNVMWAVAGTAVVAGTIMVIVGWDEDQEAVSLSIGPGSLTLSGRF